MNSDHQKRIHDISLRLCEMIKELHELGDKTFEIAKEMPSNKEQSLVWLAAKGISERAVEALSQTNLTFHYATEDEY